MKFGKKKMVSAQNNILGVYFRFLFLGRAVGVTVKIFGKETSELNFSGVFFGTLSSTSHL